MDDKLSSELVERLKAVAVQPVRDPAAVWAAAAARAGQESRRPSAVSRRVWAAAAVVAVSAAGVGVAQTRGSHHGPTADTTSTASVNTATTAPVVTVHGGPPPPAGPNGVPPGGVAWVNRPAGPYLLPSPPPSPADARGCRPGDLTVSTPRPVGAAAGMTGIEILFTNHSATACLLKGHPTVGGVSKDGSTTPLKVGRTSFIGDLGPAANLKHGQAAAVNVTGSDMCTAIIHGHHAIYPALRIRLPGPGSVTAPGRGFDAMCGVSVSPFGVLNPTLTDPPVSPLTAAITAPPAARRGQTLAYAVTLTNTTSTDYPLTPCPTYDEYILDTAGGHAMLIETNFHLNCATVQHIGAHQSERYQMELALPATMPPAASTKFGWQLHTPTGPATAASLHILE